MPPRLRVPGEGRCVQQGTGLLNIAGEKIGGSRILGHSFFMPVKRPYRKTNSIKQKWTVPETEDKEIKALK